MKKKYLESYFHAKAIPKKYFDIPQFAKVSHLYLI